MAVHIVTSYFPFTILSFTTVFSLINSFDLEHNKQYLITRDRVTSFGTAVPSSDPP